MKCSIHYKLRCCWHHHTTEHLFVCFSPSCEKLLFLWHIVLWDKSAYHYQTTGLQYQEARKPFWLSGYSLYMYSYNRLADFSVSSWDKIILLIFIC